METSSSHIPPTLPAGFEFINDSVIIRKLKRNYTNTIYSDLDDSIISPNTEDGSYYPQDAKPTDWKWSTENTKSELIRLVKNQTRFVIITNQKCKPKSSRLKYMETIGRILAIEEDIGLDEIFDVIIQIGDDIFRKPSPLFFDLFHHHEPVCLDSHVGKIYIGDQKTDLFLAKNSGMIFEFP